MSQGQTQPVSIFGRAAKSARSDPMPLAEAKGLDVGLLSQERYCSAGERHRPDYAHGRNLIDNAIRYTPKGGRIDLSVEIHPNGAAFRVQDTGPGVRPQDRELVFDPFHRVPGSDEYGSGLGLSIVKAVVDRLGADISPRESPGGGLEVTVTIPKTLIRNASPDRDVVGARRAAGERPKVP